MIQVLYFGRFGRTVLYFINWYSALTALIRERSFLCHHQAEWCSQKYHAAIWIWRYRCTGRCNDYRENFLKDRRNRPEAFWRLLKESKVLLICVQTLIQSGFRRNNAAMNVPNVTNLNILANGVIDIFCHDSTFLAAVNTLLNNSEIFGKGMWSLDHIQPKPWYECRTLLLRFISQDEVAVVVLFYPGGKLMIKPNEASPLF